MALTLSRLQFLFVGGLVTTFLVLSTIYMQERSGNGEIADIENDDLLFPEVNLVSKSASISVKNVNSSYSEPIILVWTRYYSLKHWEENLREYNCPLKCQITSDRSLLKKSSALIFHLRSTVITDIPPQPKNIGPLWILLNKEAPPHSPRDTLKAFNGKLHFTISYRRDSDLFSPYGMVVNVGEKGIKVKDIVVSEEKPKLVCWIVSHCKTSSHREIYVNILKKHIPVSIYGSCGSEKCPNDNARDCYQHIAKECKFYLSFENSLCKDYVTEKLFYALQTEMVPIVMGGANYSEILPKNSYINALDYPNPLDLANYLKELNSNFTKYKEYLKWKSKYTVVRIVYDWICEICEMLHNKTISSQNRTHTDLIKWWFDDAECTSWLDDFIP